MTVERATGLVLRTRPLTETSLIVHWLTAEAGRIATVAKGARRPRSPFRGKLDLFHRLSFTYQRSARSELHTLREVALEESCAGLRHDLAALHLASYAAALIEHASETETPLPGLYMLLLALLTELGQQAASAVLALRFELGLLAECGLAPSLSESHLSPGARAICEQWLDHKSAAARHIFASPAQLAEIERMVGRHLEFHLGRALPLRARVFASGSPGKA